MSSTTTELMFSLYSTPSPLLLFPSARRFSVPQWLSTPQPLVQWRRWRELWARAHPAWSQGEDDLHGTGWEEETLSETHKVASRFTHALSFHHLQKKICKQCDLGEWKSENEVASFPYPFEKSDGLRYFKQAWMGLGTRLGMRLHEVFTMWSSTCTHCAIASNT